MSDISPIRLRALELAVQAGAYPNAHLFLRFLQGGPDADEAFSQPATVVSSTKAGASKVRASTPQAAPAHAPAEKAAPVQQEAPVSSATTAASVTASTATTTPVAPEVFQKKCADAVLALAKVDRDSAVAILAQYKAQRFGQVAPKDYPEFYLKVEAALAAVAVKVEAALAAVAVKKAAEASDPASLV